MRTRRTVFDRHDRYMDDVMMADCSSSNRYSWFELTKTRLAIRIGTTKDLLLGLVSSCCPVYYFEMEGKEV